MLHHDTCSDFQILSLKHIQYRYLNASHIMYNANYVTARHVQWLFQILAHKHTKYRYPNASRVMYSIICVAARHFLHSRWNISNVDIAMLYTSCITFFLCYDTTCAVTNSNTRAETYQISISQRQTRHVSRYLCYTTTSVVIISNTRKETYIDSRKRCIMYRFLSDYLKKKTTPIVA